MLKALNWPDLFKLSLIILAISTLPLESPINSKGAITIGNESSLDLIMLTSKSA